MGQRTEEAWAAHDTANTLMHQATQQRNEALEKRERELMKHLFGASGQESADALARAAMADDEQLASLSRMAAKTGSRGLARAVFIEAHERGRGDLMNEYLQSNPEARPYFEELVSIPGPEERERTLSNASTVIPEPTAEQVRPSG
jgi:hypothetical protein